MFSALLSGLLVLEYGMSKLKTPTVPFVEARHQSSKQRPTAIELSFSYTTSDEGAALGIAYAWHKSKTSYEPSHYVVDEAMVYRCVPDKIVAGIPEYSEPRAIRVQICAQPISGSQFWDDTEHAKVLHRAAKLLAELCWTHKIRTVFLDENGKDHWRAWRRRGRGGIFLRNYIPAENFPAMTFLSDVEAQQLVLSRDKEI